MFETRLISKCIGNKEEKNLERQPKLHVDGESKPEAG
jgi:hypothetical protein